MAKETISERVRDVGDGLILGFPIETTEVAGKNINTVRLYFFRVGSETRYFQRYSQLAAIDSGNTTPTNGFDWLGDTGVASGSDIFRLSTDDWRVMHFGFATNNPDLQVFQAVSPDSNGLPAQDRTGQGEDIVPGTDDRGWVNQAMIADQYDPPAFTERVAFRNDRNGEFLEWAFLNNGGATLSGADLDLFFTGRGYTLQPVVTERMQQHMLEAAFTEQAAAEVDTIFHQVGGIGDYQLGSEEPGDWEDLRKSEGAFTLTLNVGEMPVPGTPPAGGGGGGGGQLQDVRVESA